MRKNKAMIFWFCLPALLSLMLMFVYPVCRTVLMSFFQVESVTASMSDWSFYGLGNYTKIFGSASFLTSMRNMLLIWLVGGVFTLTLAMLMAVIVTSGIEGIPKDLYEAATIDGAGKVHQFTHITLPLLKGVLAISAPAAYVLSRWEFTGGKALRIGLVIAMSVPVIMVIMPLYSLSVQWGIKGRVLLVLLYIMLRVPYTTIYLLDFFSTLSHTYEEAAYLDGCSAPKTFLKIMLPLVQPAIITVTIFNFMSVWNEFFMALIFTSSESMAPVGVGLLNIINSMKYTGQYGGMFAAVIIVFLPTFLLYIFMSEKIIAGVTGGGVKG